MHSTRAVRARRAAGESTMIRTFALQAAAAFACAIVIAMLLGDSESRAEPRHAGGDALALVAPCLVDALVHGA